MVELVTLKTIWEGRLAERGISHQQTPARLLLLEAMAGGKLLILLYSAEHSDYLISLPRGLLEDEKNQ